jgi:hypothetical protein
MGGEAPRRLMEHYSTTAWVPGPADEERTLTRENVGVGVLEVLLSFAGFRCPEEPREVGRAGSERATIGATTPARRDDAMLEDADLTMGEAVDLYGLAEQDT